MSDKKENTLLQLMRVRVAYSLFGAPAASGVWGLLLVPGGWG